METKFNVDQVLQIAERIQHNGANFYLKISVLFYDEERNRLCLELAGWRAKQSKSLEEYRKRYMNKHGKPVVFGYGDYIMSHPSEMADLAVFAHEHYHTKEITGQESLEEILKDAIEKSKAAIVFYQGLKEFAINSAIEDTLDKIIKQESHHINMLSARIMV
jgi:rubrerythrin